MPADFDVIIAGGGVIGASIAWRLARNQFRVLLMDAARVGAEASSAAAGMLSPAAEFDCPAMREFAAGSLAQYPKFVSAMEADSGLPIEFRRTGAVELAALARSGSRSITRAMNSAPSPRWSGLMLLALFSIPTTPSSIPRLL